jgi:hypothetical protein
LICFEHRFQKTSERRVHRSAACALHWRESLRSPRSTARDRVPRVTPLGFRPPTFSGH